MRLPYVVIRERTLAIVDPKVEMISLEIDHQEYGDFQIYIIHQTHTLSQLTAQLMV